MTKRDGAKKTKVVEKLVCFVDALPQVERVNMVKALLDRHSAAPGDPASYRLCGGMNRTKETAGL
jgi:hypothetical protein